MSCHKWKLCNNCVINLVSNNFLHFACQNKIDIFFEMVAKYTCMHRKLHNSSISRMAPFQRFKGRSGQPSLFFFSNVQKEIFDSHKQIHGPDLPNCQLISMKRSNFLTFHEGNLVGLVDLSS